MNLQCYLAHRKNCVLATLLFFTICVQTHDPVIKSPVSQTMQNTKWLKKKISKSKSGWKKFLLQKLMSHRQKKKRCFRFNHIEINVLPGGSMPVTDLCRNCFYMVHKPQKGISSNIQEACSLQFSETDLDVYSRAWMMKKEWLLIKKEGMLSLKPEFLYQLTDCSLNPL